MVPELRKRHRQIWRLWAFLLPLGFILSVVVLPRKNYPDKLPATVAAAWPVAGPSKKSEALTATLRTKVGEPGKQLEIILHRPFRAPISRVYWNEQLVGSLGAVGPHRFILDSALLAAPSNTLKIIDPVSQVVLNQIELQP